MCLNFCLPSPLYYFQNMLELLALIVFICCLQKSKSKIMYRDTSDTIATIASSSNASNSAKSQTTATAPTANFQGLKASIPPLKQKTGIVKSKVPPPVPPRGSPRDRRDTGGSQKITASAHGTPSISGSLNYLNDKFFDYVRPNPNNSCKLTPIKLHSKSPMHRLSVSPQPIFGDRRSPTCVRDWLEVNDFNASNYDPSVLECKESPPVESMTNKSRKPLPIKTSHLQRENSFRASNNSGSSVQLMIKNYSKNLNPKFRGIQRNAIRDISSVHGLDINCGSKIIDEQFVPNGHVRNMKSRLESLRIE